MLRSMPLRRTVADAARRARLTLVPAMVALVTACAAIPPEPAPQPRSAPPLPAHKEPPPPNVNLSGFPLPYRQGYADGCASAGAAERKDAARFASDPNYRTGWQDGVTLCRKR